MRVIFPSSKSKCSCENPSCARLGELKAYRSNKDEASKFPQRITLARLLKIYLRSYGDAAKSFYNTF
jgi:hypothetical protein